MSRPKLSQVCYAISLDRPTILFYNHNLYQFIRKRLIMWVIEGAVSSKRNTLYYNPCKLMEAGLWLRGYYDSFYTGIANLQARASEQLLNALWDTAPKVHNYHTILSVMLYFWNFQTIRGSNNWRVQIFKDTTTHQDDKYPILILCAQWIGD